MRPEIKSDGTEYYEYALVYVKYILVISFISMKKVEGIKCVFKLKEDKAEPPNIYLGKSSEQIETKGVTKCWSISAEKYVKAADINLEETLAKRDIQLPTSHSPMPTNRNSSEDFSNERKK